MNMLRKQFNIEKHFPFDFVYHNIKTPQNELPDHMHDLYEVIYVHQGKGTFFIDSTFYEIRSGDVFLIPGNIIHRSIPDMSDPITVTVLYFHPALIHNIYLKDDYFTYSQIFELCKSRRNYKLSLNPDHQKMLDGLLETIHRELAGEQLGYRHAVVLKMHEVLLLVSRIKHADEQRNNHSVAVRPRWMYEILNYIEVKLDENLSLSEIALSFNLSAAHLSRVFKQKTGMTITSYILSKRMQLAKKFLENSDDSVESIAYKCGFRNLAHFYREFKKFFGMTPRGYRNRLTYVAGSPDYISK